MRYIRLLYAFYKNALLAELEYRANFVVSVLMSIFWLGWSVLGLQVYFNHTQTIGGWTFDEALIVLGLFHLAHGYMYAFLQPNIAQIGEHIRLGTLDFILTKPLNSQFLASTRTLSFWRLTDVLLGVGIIVVGLTRLGATLTLLDLLLFGVLFACACVMLYALWLILVTSAFWFVRVDNITEVFSAFYEAARFPIGVYRGLVRAALTFFIPIAFITTVPAAALIHRLEPNDVLYALVLAGVLFVVSARFWRFALRFYSSASS